MSEQALRILIVEDHLLIAKQLEVIAAGAGHDVVGIAATEKRARNLAQSAAPDIVFLDVSLAEGSSGIEVGTFIADNCEAHVVFTTANRRRIPDDYCGAVGVVEKPFTRLGLLSALTYISARIRDADNMSDKPDSLQLSPAYTDRWQHSAS